MWLTILSTLIILQVPVKLTACTFVFRYMCLGLGINLNLHQKHQKYLKCITIHAHSISNYGRRVENVHAEELLTGNKLSQANTQLATWNSYKVWPPTKVSLRKYARMHCSWEALWEVTKRPDSVKWFMNIFLQKYFCMAKWLTPHLLRTSE